MQALDDYHEQSRKKVLVQYILLGGVNDGVEQVREHLGHDIGHDIGHTVFVGSDEWGALLISRACLPACLPAAELS